MASHVPVAIQDENFQIHRGKGLDAGKTDALNGQKAHNVRKPLMDLSKHAKNSITGSSKVSVLKQKAGPPGKNKKGVQKKHRLTEEEIRQCNEWAKEGREHIKFSGTDMHIFEKEKAKHDMDNEVNMFESGFRDWTRMACLSILSPLKKVVDDHEDHCMVGLEPEVLELPWSLAEQEKYDALSPLNDNEPMDCFVDDERYSIDFKLKEEYEVEAS